MWTQPMGSLTNYLIQWKKKVHLFVWWDWLINSGKMISVDHVLHIPNSELRPSKELINKIEENKKWKILK